MGTTHHGFLADASIGKELLRLPERLHADYKVATVQWMGCALFAENMKPLDEFIEAIASRR